MPKFKKGDKVVFSEASLKEDSYPEGCHVSLAHILLLQGDSERECIANYIDSISVIDAMQLCKDLQYEVEDDFLLNIASDWSGSILREDYFGEGDHKIVVTFGRVWP